MSLLGRPAKAIEADPRPSLNLSNDVAIEDWDLLFDAVVERLRSTFEDLDPSMATRRSLTWAQARDSVMECAQALEQLHLTATHELSHGRQTDDVRRPLTRRPAGILAAEGFPKIQHEVVRDVCRAWCGKLRARVEGPPLA